MKKLDFVRQFIKMGISCMPLYHRSKEPVLPAWRELQTRLPTHTEYLEWFSGDWNNYGVICGWCNLVVIDFDSMFLFDLWREWVSATQYGCTGFRVQTRKGMHVYLQTITPAANDKRVSRSGGVDIQAQGKYVVGPGCVHPSGFVYEPIGDFVFPVVDSVESVLPLDLFPRVRAEAAYNGAQVVFERSDTEYLLDPFDTRDLISKVKSLVRIESLFTGVQRSSTDGRWLKALCPFHQDKHQSAWIDTVRQLAGCQVCGMKPMDIINVYARTRGMSESAAVKALAQEVNVWA